MDEDLGWRTSKVDGLLLKEIYMIVYAIKEGTVIWSDHRSVHKAGRVPLHEPLTVISESVGGWYAIDRPANLSLPEDPNYTKHWVKTGDTTARISDPVDPPVDPGAPDPGLVIGEVSDNDLAIAIVVILKWLKQ
jgi:hypothetical protein